MRDSLNAELLTEEVEAYRDQTWRRTPELRVEAAADAERLVESLGFCASLTDARRPGPSLYIAVCGRRDAHMPRNVQKDPEASLAWVIKDEVMRRGRIYYAKLARARSMFIAPRLVPHFNALWGIPRKKESEALSADARAVLKVLQARVGDGDRRPAEGVRRDDRARFTRAIDELQRAMKVIPGEVLYEPWFTYVWTLAEGRFHDGLSAKVKREVALKEVARAFLDGAGVTASRGACAVTGLSRPDAGLGNRALVKEGYAERIAEGVYRLTGSAKAEASSRLEPKLAWPARRFILLPLPCFRAFCLLPLLHLLLSLLRSRLKLLFARVSLINSAMFSFEYSLVLIGSWTVMRTVEGKILISPLGIIFVLPEIDTGTTGTPASIAIINAPFLKGSSRPSRERVPSG